MDDSSWEPDGVKLQVRFCEGGEVPVIWDARCYSPMYLARDGEALIILFGGGTKRGQQKDIGQAKALHAEYKERKKTLTTAKKVKR